MEIIFHIGPPKTGTSAIQYWMAKHQDWLLVNNIYYPGHLVDKNLISSGNFLHLFELNDCSKYVFSAEKYIAVVEEAERLKAKKVIFSSEYFFDNVEVISEFVPEAKFIFYLRNELEVVESSHNQSVKRHKKINPFIDISKPISSPLRKLLRYYQTLGAHKFIYRYYASPLFVNENIIADFLHSIGTKVSSTFFQDRSINSSYSHNALELKRWFNRFDDEKFHQSLDEFLQFISAQKEGYSLMTPSAYQVAKEGYLAQIKEFLNLYNLKNKEEFISYCVATEQARFMPQKICQTNATELLKEWLAYDPSIYSMLKKIHKQATLKLSTEINDNVYNALSISIRQERFMSLKQMIKKLSLPKNRVNNIPDDYYNLEKLTPNQVKSKKIEGNQNNNILLISHHIPKTAGSSFGKGLIEAYGRDNILGVYKNTGAHCLSGGKLSEIPSCVSILHGHFTTHEKQRENFPNAKQICWVRDPVERLWSLTKHILRNKQPLALFNAFDDKLSQEKTLLDSSAFNVLLSDPTFSRVREDYQRYFEYVKPNEFDFVGSMHRYDDEIVRLKSILGVNLPSLNVNIAPNQNLLRATNPDLYFEARHILRNEFILVEDYL